MSRAQRRRLRRLAARRAWRATDPDERSWDSLAATSAMAGWLGPSAAGGHGLLDQEDEVESRADEAVAEVARRRVAGVTRLRAAWSRRPVMGFGRTDCRPLA